MATDVSPAPTTQTALPTEQTPRAVSTPMRLPRTTGALSGLLIILLGVWGALIPFVGPYFHYSFGHHGSWYYTSNRLWLDILPGAVAALGGFLLLTGTRRASGLLGGWLAGAAGAWFAIGPTVSLLWQPAGDPIGRANAGHVRQMLELLGYFHGLGAVILALAAFATGRYFSRPRVVEEPAVVASAPAGEVAQRRRLPAFLRRRRRVAA